jgi:hypothetical protein
MTASLETGRTRTARKAKPAQDVEAELAELRAEIAALKAGLTSAPSGLKDNVEALLADVLQGSGLSLGDLTRQLEQLEETVETGLRRHPVKALLAAFGLGVLMARFLGRDNGGADGR